MNSNNSIRCPLCKDPVEKLLYRYHLDSERAVINRIKSQHPGWSEFDGACSRCVDYYHTEIVMQQRILPEIGPHFSVRTADDFLILPTGLRLNVDPRYTGKGITICFIDSGFCLHPDLTTWRNRIKKVVDITAEKPDAGCFSQPHPESWHGTMTSVVCAGDGYLSNGLYKGIASDAELVLIKVQDAGGRISSTAIIAALQWVLQNHQEYGIRIVNISLGGDEVISYRESKIDLLAEQLIKQGINIIAAAGNDENGQIRPPANSLNVITVGGVDDENRLQEEAVKLYHSTYGKTEDNLLKPELIAPAIWIAAPILPGTEEQNEATILYRLLQLSDGKLQEELGQSISDTKLTAALVRQNDVTYTREAILQRIREAKYISPHFMHVDGTSFAAPVVSSVVAQLLEINPALTPAMIRQTLFSSAKRIDGLPAERQGFGVLQPRKSVLKILKRKNMTKPDLSPFVNFQQNCIAFYIQNDCASQISLAGSFNHWAQDILLMEPGTDGIWKIEIPMLPAGRYHYKFFVDDKMWMEDVENPYREPDGFSGFNSILTIEN